MIKKAIYPGSFDPLHQGHLDVIKKALKIFDKIIVVVSINPDKNNLVNIKQRYLATCQELKAFENVEVVLNEADLMANVAKKYDANFIIRSARNETDYKYELELAAGNNSQNQELETILIIPDYKMIEYSSTLLRHKRKLGK